MKKRMVFIICLISVLGLFQSCDLIFNVAQDILGMDNQSGTSNGNQNNNSDKLEPVNPNTIKGRAYNRALYYLNEDTEYKKGGTGRIIYPFDCSGFVYRCYLDAIEGTNAKLNINTRPNVSSLYESGNNFTRNIHSLQETKKGDLIFIDYNKDKGEYGTYPNHVGIIHQVKGNKIYFIDSSSYNYTYNNAVQIRHIDINDKRIMGYREVIVKTPITY